MGQLHVVKRMMYFAYEFLPQGVTHDSPAAALVHYLVARGVHNPHPQVAEQTAGPDRPPALEPGRLLMLPPSST